MRVLYFLHICRWIVKFHKTSLLLIAAISVLALGKPFYGVSLPIGNTIPGLIPSVIGPDTACAGGETAVYSTESGMMNYLWTVSSGGTIVSGNGTNTVQVAWNQPGTGTISVSYAGSAAPGTLDVHVFPMVTASLSVSASQNPSCAGSVVSFSASPVNGGSTPAYQWQVNGMPAGSGSGVFNYTPSNGDIVTCAMNTSLPCASPAQVTSAPLVMTVQGLLIAGVTIAASGNPVCDGSTVTFTATPANSGASPAYVWKVNGVAVSSAGPVYSYNPVSGDQVTCEMTSSLSCISNSPAVSNTVVMIVSPALAVGVIVTPSANPVCSGSAVSLSATVTNGGVNPQYAWKVNGTQVSSGSPVYTYTPSNGDEVVCQVVSGLSCAVGNPAVSAPVVIGVTSLINTSVTISPSANPVCQGNAVVYTAFPVNGGANPAFQWTVNGFPVGSNSSALTYTPANNDLIACKLYSSIGCPAQFPVISNTITMSVNPNLPVSISISASANPVCIGEEVTFIAGIFNGGSSPVYTWKVNGVVTGTNSSSMTYTPVNGDQVSCILVSSNPCSPSVPVQSNLVVMSVSPLLPVDVAISASANPVCQNVQVLFTASAINGGTNPSFQWYVNGMASGAGGPVFSHIPVDGDQITCVMTSGALCTTNNPALSNTVTMAVIPSLGMPVSVDIAASSNPSCEGASVTYLATAVNGGNAPVFDWTVNGLSVGTNSFSYTYIPAMGDVVQCMVTSDLGCAVNNPAMSNQVVMTVNPVLPVSVSIISSANPSCLGAMVTYTANAVNGGPSAAYVWKLNGIPAGANQNTFQHSPLNGETISCTVTSSLGCSSGNPANSNTITATVYPILPVSVTISTLTNPSCTGSQVGFNATISNGGTNPVYQWRLNGVPTGANNAVLMFTPQTGDVITCRLTSNALCRSGSNVVFSNPITMTVSPELAPSVAISSSVNPFCEGSPVTYTASPTNGGTLPVYQWQVNCQPVGTNSAVFTYAPQDGDFVTCKMTSNLTCAVRNPCKSNAVTMRRNNTTPAGIGITVAANPVCPGEAAIFSATVVNGGTAPAYQWKVNGVNAGGNSPGFSYIPVHGDVVICQVVSNASCVSGNPAVSNPVTVQVSPSLPASVSISTPTNPFCSGTAVTFSAAGINGGPAPAYQWKVNNMSVGSNSPQLIIFPASGDIVTCLMTSGASCISGPNPVLSNQLVMEGLSAIVPQLTVTPSVNPSCAGQPVAFQAVYTGGGEVPLFEWHVNGLVAGNNATTFTYSPAAGDVVECLLHSDLSCATPANVVSNQVTMSVNAAAPVSVTITPSVNPVCAGNPVTFTSGVVNGGTVTSYQWFVNCVATGAAGPEYTYIPTNGDVVVCHVISNEPCATGNPAVSNNINMEVLPEQPATINVVPSMNPFCIGSPVTFTATISNGGNSPQYQWMVNGIAVGPNSYTFTYPPNDLDTVTCTLTSNAVCVTGNPATSNQVIMNGISAIPVSVTISASNNPICQGTNVAFTAVAVNAGNNPNYQWKVNGNNAGPNHHTYQYPPAIGDVVACHVSTPMSCASPNPAISNQIDMTVYPQAPVSVNITVSANPTCQGTPVTFNATVINGGATPLYRWRVNGVLTGTNSPVFTYTPVNGDVVYCRVTANGVVCATGNPSNSNQIVMEVNPTTPAAISIAPGANPVCQGNPVTFTSTTSNGGSAPLYIWTVNGATQPGNTGSFTYVPAHGDEVRCELISNSTCTALLNAMSNIITMTVSPVQPVSVIIIPTLNPVCTNTNVTYQAIAANGGPVPQYQWKVNGSIQGAGSPQFTYIPLNGDIVTCQLTSSLVCATGSPAISEPLVMTVSETLPTDVSVVASRNPSCQGETITLTATPVNGGLNPVFQWLVNGIQVGEDTGSYSLVPAQGDAVTCRLTSDLSCAVGNPALAAPLLLQVDPILPVAVYIESSSNPVCAGSLVTYTATPINGGSTPQFQWMINGSNTGINSSTFSFIPVNGDTVVCTMVSSINCPADSAVNSNILAMTVVEPDPSSVSIYPSQNPVCAGSTVTLTAVPVNGGISPIYQWKVNGIPVGTGEATYTFFPVNGDVVVCEMTSASTCVTNATVPSDPVVVQVSTDIPVSVSIAAAANPVCAGQQASFSATVINGGIQPSFQWMVNGFNVGGNSPFYSYIPTNGDAITCLATSDLSCASGNPALAEPVIMEVLTTQQTGISITVSANPVCAGTAVQYSASLTNQAASATYQWLINGQPAGTNSATLSWTPANGDMVVCQAVPTDPCFSGNPVNSNVIIMMVSTDLPASVTISASANNVCAGTPVSFSSAVINGGNSPQYQWLVNNLPSGNGLPQFTYIPTNGDEVKCVLTSNLTCASNNPDTSVAVVLVVTDPQPASVFLTSNTVNPVCQGTSVVLTANAVNGGTAPTYQWMKNGQPAGISGNSYAITPTDGDQVYAVMQSNQACVTGSPAISDTLVFAVVAPLAPSVTVSANQNNVCTGTQVTITAAVVNGGPTPSYQWFLNGVPAGTGQPDFTFVPANGDAVYVDVTSGLTCVTTPTATSNVIIMTVTPLLPVSVAVTASQNPVCQGSPVTFVATPVNGGIPAYQWYVNGIATGANLPEFTYTPADGDQVHAEMTTSLTCVTASTVASNIIAMSVIVPVTPSISVLVSQNPVCSQSQVTFTATPVNGGVPVFQWFLNSQPVGDNFPEYTCIPANGDRVWVEMVSSLECAIPQSVVSDTITMQVDEPLPVSVIIAESQNNICAGTLVEFTATGANGGVPVFRWYLNGILQMTGAPVYSCIPEDGDQVMADMTTSLTCALPLVAQSNIVLMNVNSPVTPSVMIRCDTGHVCKGTPVTFEAVPTNGGNPSYSWYVNGDSVSHHGTQFQYVPEDGDQVWVEMSTTLECVTSTSANSNVIAMEVDDLLTVKVTISVNQNSVCAGTEVTCQATPMNGGVEQYTWYLNGLQAGGNEPVFKFIPADNDRIHVKMTTSLTCVDSLSVVSNQVLMEVKPFPNNALAITGPAEICSGPAVLEYSIPEIQNASAYQWNIPVGATVAYGLNLPVIGLVFPSAAGSYIISVSGLNECGTGTASSPLTVKVIQTPGTPEIVASGNVLVSNSGLPHTWYFNGLAVADSSSFTLTPREPGWYWCSVQSDGCLSDTSNHLWFDGWFPGNGGEEYGIWVYPVPNDGHFTVAISLPEEDVFDIEVYNMLGMKLFTHEKILVKNRFKEVIDLRPRMPKGLLTVIFTCSTYKVVKKVLVYNK